MMSAPWPDIRRFASALIALSLGLEIGCGPGIADFSRDLGAGYTYYSVDALQKFVLDDRNEYAIPSLVFDVDSDDSFIVGLRLAVKEYRCDLRGGSTGYVTSEIEYWIISKREKRTIGPLSRSEFGELRKQLGVSVSLAVHEDRAASFLELARQVKRAISDKPAQCRPVSPTQPVSQRPAKQAAEICGLSAASDAWALMDASPISRRVLGQLATGSQSSSW